MPSDRSCGIPELNLIGPGTVLRIPEGASLAGGRAGRFIVIARPSFHRADGELLIVVRARPALPDGVIGGRKPVTCRLRASLIEVLPEGPQALPPRRPLR